MQRENQFQFLIIIFINCNILGVKDLVTYYLVLSNSGENFLLIILVWWKFGKILYYQAIVTLFPRLSSPLDKGVFFLQFYFILF